MTAPQPNDSQILSGLGAAFFDSILDDYQSSPGSVDAPWNRYFESLTADERAALSANAGERSRAAQDESLTAGPLVAPHRPGELWKEQAAETGVGGALARNGNSSGISSDNGSGNGHAAPGAAADVPPARSDAPAKQSVSVADGRTEPLRGVAGKIVENMVASLEIPTATTFRTIPVRALEENRKLLNATLEQRKKSKLTFTHLVGFALVRALEKHPALNHSYEAASTGHARRIPSGINFGLAIDLPKPDGTRSLVVPNIKNSGAKSFSEFVAAVDDVIARGRAGKLVAADFQGTTITLTNPGTLGTVASVPRLMKGQGAIIATGAIDYPAELAAMPEAARAELGISKVMGITSTYDHRVIQGAESGAFLATVHEFLVGKHDFYQQIFTDLQIPQKPFLLTSFLAGPDTRTRTAESGEAVSSAHAVAAWRLVDAFRRHGHRAADLDPLHLAPGPGHPELDPAFYALSVFDLDRPAPGLNVTFRALIERLRSVYCGTTAFEFQHLPDTREREFFIQKAEGSPVEFSNDQSVHILRRLAAADLFEKFIHTRYTGQKRFSLEGGDALIPALDMIFTKAARAGLSGAVIGMAHRGRLNVLGNLVGMPLPNIFAEFEGAGGSLGGYSGDVKYHLGYDGIFECKSADESQNLRFQVALACNPSHLEAVNPVVEGVVRAKQDALHDGARTAVLPILIHGDAAFAGQGVVMETLQFSLLEGYKTGGTVHLIVNNQIGYTANPADSRSTLYCSDLAKGIDAPVIHVNGDDAAAVVRAALLAFEFRQTFHKDVFIDLVCYRRHGHNEGDEPTFTQPVMYQKVRNHPAPRTLYEQSLVAAKKLDPSWMKEFEAAYTDQLAAARDAVRNKTWVPGRDIKTVAPVVMETAVRADVLHSTGLATCQWPAEFSANEKIDRQFKKRRQMLDGTIPVDYGAAETFAFATLLAEGVNIRLVGEDSGRGTFSHRHSVLHDVKTGQRYIPLNHLAGPGQPAQDQGRYEVYDSLLSEEAALGFEYGYSVEAHREGASNPRHPLVIWEAQFGDFCNGAQIQIDQFIAAGNAKWNQDSGLVMLLPHGYEGQGPEHSSARIERFLQLCARDNMRIVNITNAAQIFHLLRDQAWRRPHTPLVVMTPKSLLRADYATSPLAAFSAGGFATVLDDPAAPHTNSAAAAACRRVLVCSGKVYYDLLAARERGKHHDVAIVRVEQLYPIPAREISARLQAFRNAQIVWVQEEPVNMGAGFFMKPVLEEHAPGRQVSILGRPANSSPAVGTHAAHQEELRRLLDAAFAG